MPRFIAHFSWSILLAALAPAVHGQTASPRAIAPGVWFLLGDASKGYSNTAVIEMTISSLWMPTIPTARAN